MMSIVSMVEGISVISMMIPMAPGFWFCFSLCHSHRFCFSFSMMVSMVSMMSIVSMVEGISVISMMIPMAPCFWFCFSLCHSHRFCFSFSMMAMVPMVSMMVGISMIAMMITTPGFRLSLSFWFSLAEAKKGRKK